MLCILILILLIPLCRLKSILSITQRLLTFLSEKKIEDKKALSFLKIYWSVCICLVTDMAFCGSCPRILDSAVYVHSTLSQVERYFFWLWGRTRATREPCSTSKILFFCLCLILHLLCPVKSDDSYAGMNIRYVLYLIQTLVLLTSNKPSRLYDWHIFCLMICCLFCAIFLRAISFVQNI